MPVMYNVEIPSLGLYRMQQNELLTLLLMVSTRLAWSIIKAASLTTIMPSPVAASFVESGFHTDS